jgi:hypothetical protein
MVCLLAMGVPIACRHGITTRSGVPRDRPLHAIKRCLHENDGERRFLPGCDVTLCESPG